MSQALHYASGTAQLFGNGFDTQVTEVGGSAPAILSDGDASTLLRITNAGNASNAQAYLPLPAWTDIPTEPTARKLRITMKHYNVGPLLPLGDVLADPPAAQSWVVADIVTATFPLTASPTYVARTTSSQSPLLTTDATTYELDIQGQSGYSLDDLDAILAAGSNVWLLLEGDLPGLTPESDRYELSIDHIEVALVWEYVGTPPLRQNQRDDLRQNQRTSRQLTVRQRGYL